MLYYLEKKINFVKNFKISLSPYKLNCKDGSSIIDYEAKVELTTFWSRWKFQVKF